MSDSCRIIAIDRLVHGLSDKPHDPAEYLEPSIVADIVAVLDAEHVERALVWGYSLGSRNGASLAALEPTRVAALVCCSGPPLPATDAARQRQLALADAVTTDEGMTGIYRSIGADEATIEEGLARNDVAASWSWQARSAPRLTRSLVPIMSRRSDGPTTPYGSCGHSSTGTLTTPTRN